MVFRLPGQRNKPMFEMPESSRMERDDIAKAYARVFSSEDGKKVLSHLQSVAFMRAYSAESTDEQIRYAEGQRALVATMMRLVNSGRGA